MYYTKKEYKQKIDELKSIKDKSTDDYYFKYMKVVYSFGRIRRLTKKGIDKGRELHKKWLKGEKMGRKDILLLGFLLSDICVLDGNMKIVRDLKTVYEQTITAYKPDFDYMSEFAKTILPEKGYSEMNTEYMESVEQMFLNDYVYSEPEQVTMIHSGVMPLDELKVCPYCSKDFAKTNVEDLFKHVKENHGKK